MRPFRVLLLLLFIPTISNAGFIYTANFPPPVSASIPTPPSGTSQPVSGGGVAAIGGCTDPLASNYNKSASLQSVKCLYGSQKELPQQALATCVVRFKKYQQFGNSGDEVAKIKDFLRTKEGHTLNTSKVYDRELFKAVKSFQEKYRLKVLSPWELLRPTGWWYKSTRKMANEILGCPEPEVLLDNGILLR